LRIGDLPPAAEFRSKGRLGESARARRLNHLHLRDAMPPEIVGSAQEAVRSVVDAGGRAAHVAKVDDRHLVRILVSTARKTPPESHAT
jgi:hypothetical protein